MKTCGMCRHYDRPPAPADGLSDKFGDCTVKLPACFSGHKMRVRPDEENWPEPCACWEPREGSIAAVLAGAASDWAVLRGEVREEYVKAWLAKTGLRPDECKVVEQIDGGKLSIWVEPIS